MCYASVTMPGAAPFERPATPGSGRNLATRTFPEEDARRLIAQSLAKLNEGYVQPRRRRVIPTREITMTRLEVVRGIGHAPVALIDVPDPVHLKCPACLTEFDRPTRMAIDVEIECSACDVTSEFRELHEAWCLSRRPLLAKVFPELEWVTADYAHSDVCRGGETRNSIA
jgi:hypothetical protein